MSQTEVDKIDLSPVRITEIVKSSNSVSVIMPRQPCYSQMTKEITKGELPFYSCEFRIDNGNVQLLNIDLPFKTDDWEIKCDHVAWSCFLPFDFVEEGNVVLTFRNERADKNAIIITGTKISLFIGEKTGAEEVFYVDPEIQAIAQELYEYISELSEEAICAGWMENIEYALWERVLNGTGNYYALEVTEDIIAKLRDYSDRAGGWWSWEGREPVFLSAEDWGKLYEKYSERRVW